MLDGNASRALGHAFRDPALLRQALTHRSHSQPHNERLEFIGDAVLNCVIATELFKRFPALPEGDLSRHRAALVNQATLASHAQALSLGAQLRLGEGELRSGGAHRPSILADAVEALIGAVYLDGGFAVAEAAVLLLFADLLDGIDVAAAGKDAKTALQEWLQARRLALPEYRVTSVTGEAHRQQFDVECLVAGGIRGHGSGASRRTAEQTAAREALAQLRSESPP